jgi:hypothetical protein
MPGGTTFFPMPGLVRFLVGLVCVANASRNYMGPGAALAACR